MATQNIVSYASNSVNNPGNIRKIVFNAGVEAALEYAEPQKIRSPKIQLLFSPFGLPFVPLEIVGTNAGKIVSSMSWYKDRNNPGGMLSLTIVPDARTIQDIVDIINKFSGNLYSKIWGELGVDLQDLFKPKTLCQLWIDGYHVMTGTVRSCERSSSVGNDSKDVSYSLSIDELGNIYDMNIVSLDTILLDGMQINSVDSTTKAMDLASMVKGVPVSEGLKMLFSAFHLTALLNSFSGSDGIPLSLRLRAEANPLGGIANLSFAQNMILDTSMFQLSGGQSFWGFVKNLIPNPWMELYTESGGRTITTDNFGAPSVLFPGFNYVVCRSVPYSNPLLGQVNPALFSQTFTFELNALRLLLGGDFIIITDDDIENKNLGHDCSNQHTIFHSRYTSNAGLMPMDSDDKPIISVGPLNPFASGGIKTFGSREMFQTMNCTSLFNFGAGLNYVERIAKNKIGLPFQVMSKPALSNLLAVWFRNQSRFREGTVTTRYIPYARPGMYCLYLPSLSGKKPENLRDIGIYYIDGLTHNYSLEDSDVICNSTFNLVRGVPIPTTIAQTALLLFDFERIPPGSGLYDGEFSVLQALRTSLTGA